MYLVRPTVRNAKLIADQMNADKKFLKKKRYKVLYVPRRMFACDMIMEEEGVFEDGIYEEFKLDLIPLDDDILSLELPGFFKDFFLNGDQTWIQSIAMSIVNLQNLFGTIPHIYGMGRCSNMVFDLVKVLQTIQGRAKSAVNNEIGHLILIDRDQDLVTPLCTQTTYEGLVDERYGVNCGFCEFPANVTGTNKSMKLLLNTEDMLFEEIRNRHISNVFGFLSQQAKLVQSGYSKGRNIASIGEMKDYVQKELKDLKQQYKSLTIHIGACEGIIQQTSKQVDFQEQLQTEHSMLDGSKLKDCYTYVEEQIARQTSPMRSLRLCCLLSLTQNGLPTKDFKSLQTHYLQSYGYDSLLTFYNLKKLGMFTEQTTVEMSKMSASDVRTKIAEKALKRTSFRFLCKRLNLIPKTGDINLRNPDDMSFVFSGSYTPLSCKLVEQILMRIGWGGLEDVKKHLSGPCFEDHRGLSRKIFKNPNQDPVTGSLLADDR
ncbi:putative vacuolar protein sorting-associated protein 33B isoform X3 [Apostichopus japonicus]|uniref:Putative vacuolar protein sorting-associated protein 33B isoform X3 n=1 Tax=Stichopus japonicus TaxID=307972 RepID=A0A2G8LLZ2_STIJA|nr:putative vacuolar protein sorting-associated protein 33B isoform X3 [Apostichopus japonicus]